MTRIPLKLFQNSKKTVARDCKVALEGSFDRFPAESDLGIIKVAYDIMKAALGIKGRTDLPKASVLSCLHYRSHKNLPSFIMKTVSLIVIQGKINIILSMYFQYA